MKKIYLAPSNQRNNAYKNGTNEAAVCIDIATRIKAILTGYNCLCYLGEEKKTLQEKTSEANSIGADVYLSIHSNAGGGKGTECWYNPNTKGSKDFAQAVYKRIAQISIGKDRGLKSSVAYLDVKLPKMPCCLCEMEFHDWIDGANWLVEHKQEIAEQFVLALVDYLGIQKKVETAKTTTTTNKTVVKVGDTVKLNIGALYYDGKKPASFVYKRNYKVKEVKNDRVVITYLGITVGAVHAKDLKIVSVANKAATTTNATTNTTTTAKKSNEDVAKEVINGKWGNGADRKKRLADAGYDYATIQALVNKLLK